MVRSARCLLLAIALNVAPVTGQEPSGSSPQIETLPVPPIVLAPVAGPPALEAPEIPEAVLPVAEGEVSGKEANPAAIGFLNEFWGYRSSIGGAGWTVGDGDQFGGFALEADRYRPAGLSETGLTGGFGVQFLSGPQRTDMPPRLFDFSLGYQRRDVVGEFAYDVSMMVLAASDFEGSSRDGIRFPAHAVGYLTLSPRVEVVFGVDFLDRDDVHVLPVAGLLLRPDPDVRIELVFPRPSIDLQLNEDYRFCLRGGLGGGTWAVERDSELDDLASLYQLELGAGVFQRQDEGAWQALEVVYLFDRQLEYASGIGDYSIGSTIMLRSSTRY